MKRFLRDLHRGNERDEREKQRAKDEVARLNGTNVEPSSSPSGRDLPKPFASILKQHATPAERKQQMTQLAEMGVAIPEEFRRDMAMVGDWQTLSQRVIDEETGGVKKQELDEDAKPNGVNVGVRKRKYEGEEEEEDGGATLVRRGWGNTTRLYPGSGGDDNELDALLSSTTSAQAKPSLSKAETKYETAEIKPTKTPQTTDISPDSLLDNPSVKIEETFDSFAPAPLFTQDFEKSLGRSDDKQDIGVVFKKRRPKVARQI